MEDVNVLFVDDEKPMVQQLIRSFERRTSAFKCHGVYNEAQAISLARQIQPEVIVLDLCIEPSRGPESGLSLIPKLYELVDCVRILVLTGHNEAEWGIRSINAGVASFLSKPVDTDHLLALLNDGIHVARLMRANKAKDSEVQTATAALGLTTQSEKMTKVLEQVAFAAATLQPVLLCGETGVGKGIIAQAIHRGSKRSKGAFIRMQPSFGSHDLIASELFGHTRGAFTGANETRTGLIEEADGGTLFLDEIDTLPQQTQVALLHVLQEKEFTKIGSSKKCRSDFRLISATNTPFNFLSDGSLLRLDFYHRIAQNVIHVPSLRERRADIPQLARDFVNKLAADDKESTVYGLNNEACAWLAAQPWPGNVRELFATVEQGYTQAMYHRRGLIWLSDLQRELPPVMTSLNGSLSEQVRNYELAIANSVFTKHKQNYSETARALGIDRKRLRRILNRAAC